MKRKIAALVATSIVVTNTMPTISVFADEIARNKAGIVKEVSQNMVVKNFKIKNYENFTRYNEAYRVNVKSITNNGDKYNQSIITNAIDGKLETHWETGRENKADFKNEVEFEFENVEKINRLAYATRQDGAKPKGYPKVAQILVADSDEAEYTLVGEVASNKVTGDMVEFKFDTVEAKKVKFVFSDVHDGWASASEFWFYKEDKILDKMETLFTNDKKNEVSDEFKNIEVLKTLEEEAKTHPFYEKFKIELEDAKMLLEENNVEYKDAEVFKFKSFGSKELDAYNEIYKIDNKHITNITTNGRHWADNTIDKAIDGNPETSWHSDAKNSATHTNEVIMTLDEVQTLDKVVYTSQRDRGFAKEFEIYVSKTLEGDTFTKVTSGNSSITKDSIAIKFNPTKARRVKFVFKNGHEGWALASEFGLYKEDTTMDSMRKLFTDSSKTEVSDEFKTAAKLEELEKQVKSHPFYNDYKDDISDAKLLLEGNNVEYKDANVFKFKEFGSKELVQYDKTYKVDNNRIINITTNGSHWSDSTIDKAIDDDITTSWHSNNKNSSTHTNEVVMTLDKLETIDKVVYTNKRARGFAEKFEIYTSRTLSGDTFTKVTEGSASRTTDSLAIQFNPTEVRRVKFVFKQAYEGWAVAAEFGLYKEDEVLDKMARLFTDDTITAVSEEFDTVEELNALENECKKHPLYEDFKEDLDNARALVEQGKIEVSKAQVSSFNHLGNDKYLEQFRMPYENIKSIKSNAPHYQKQDINKAVDGKMDTYWETNKANSRDWSNEVTVEFNNPVTIDRLAYAARQTDRKGFLEEFEIYGSNTTKGDDFHLIATGKTVMVSGLVEAKFKPTTFKRLKLKWIKGEQNWATLAELMFFKQDTVADKVNNMFTDGFMTTLKDEYNSSEVIEALEKEVMNHPLKDELIPSIEIAKKILNGGQVESENISRTVTGVQRGATDAERAKRHLARNAFTSFESFGRYVTPGEELIVYVDADPSGKMPQLAFGQIANNKGAWRRTVNLRPGRNVIKAPTDMNCAAVYLVNEAYPEEQAYAPRVRFEGGTQFPTYFHGETDPKEFAKELEEYANKVEYSDAAFVNGNPNGKVYNIAEFVSENAVITTTAKGAVKGLKKAGSKGYDASDTMEGWEEIYAMFQDIMGFEENAEDERDSIFPGKFVARGFHNIPHAFAGSGFTGYLGSTNPERDGYFFDQLAMPPQMADTDDWAYTHEFGHIFNTGEIEHLEVSNNIFSQAYRRLHPEKGGDRSDWSILNRFKGEDFNLGAFGYLAVLNQLEIAYDYQAYTKASKFVRHNEEIIKSIKGDGAQRLVVAYSLGLGVDLTDFFGDWKYTKITDQMREAVAHLPKPDKKIEYIHGGALNYKGDGFSEDVKVTVSSSINKEKKTNTLKFSIDNDNSTDLLGYEILKDGEFLGYTKDNSFVIKNIDVDENTKYEVVAYAKDLSTAKPVNVQTFQPKLETVGGLTLTLNEEFNPLDYVKATNYEGNIISDIKVTSNVDTAAIGDYTVTYEVTANNITSTETMKVSVASAYDYLSDLKWKSAKTQYDSVTRNQDIKGRELGEIKDYAKGIRIHANGEVVYDLGEHNYDTLELKVGVAMNIAAQNNSSITFKVVGDGKTLATTNVIKHDDSLKYIKVPVKGVKELKIEVNDGGNGITSDHGVIVEPKLSTNNAKPKLTIPKSQTVKVGETLDDVIGTYEATDTEDGNLTEKVIVTGQDKVNLNRVGSYTITYTVTDKDGNKTEKSRIINVVNSEDVKYLSDFDWKSATNGWGTIGKDHSISNKKLRITGKDGKEVSYEKGIGVHAHSEIVYDLTDKDATLFSAFVGVDREMINGPSSVEFKVYLDGDLEYESGVMRARDAQKYVEVDVTGAKELKLVVTTGGDGNGSDHADWADAKLYFVNKSRIDKSELTNLVNEAKKLNEYDYTEESFNKVQIILDKAEQVLEDSNDNQDTIDSVTAELQESIKSLTVINLDEVIDIPDKYLAKSLHGVLGKSEGFTIGDMRSLTNLSLSGVINLEGLQYAKNLEVLNIEYNEISDLSPLKNLKKLTDLRANPQIIAGGQIAKKDNRVTINYDILNRKGEKLSPKSVIIRNNQTLEDTTLDLDKCVDKNGVISFDTTNLDSVVYSVYLEYEDTNDNYLSQVLFMFSNK